MRREHSPDGSFKENSEKLPPPAYRYRRRSSTFDCQIKDYHSRYLEQSGLDNHIKRDQNPDGSLKEKPEKHCPKRFSRKGLLDQHISVIHENVKEYKCEQCPYGS